MKRFLQLLLHLLGFLYLSTLMNGSLLFPVNDKYSVYYLVIGEDTIVDRRDEIPEKTWVSTPIGIVNKSTGLDDFIRMSKDERQVMLDGINNALYSQIAGAGVPYSSYRYFVGDTVIAENKRFLDPYSVKLK